MAATKTPYLKHIQFIIIKEPKISVIYCLKGITVVKHTFKYMYKMCTFFPRKCRVKAEFS